MNKQREIIYGVRSQIVAAEQVREHLLDVVQDVIYGRAEDLGDDEESLEAFATWVNSQFPIGFHPDQAVRTEGRRAGVDAAATARAVVERVEKAYADKCALENPQQLNSMERFIMLNAVDTQWQEYLRNMDTLRQGVGLRAYGQRDQLVEYKNEAYTLFADLMDRIKGEIAGRIFRATTSPQAYQNFLGDLQRLHGQVKTQHADLAPLAGGHAAVGGGRGGGAGGAADAGAEAAMNAALAGARTVVRDAPKVGRNDPCPCGSGKKYKKCCGKDA